MYSVSFFILLRSHQQTLHGGNLYASSVQGKQLVALHLVQRSTDVQSAVVQVVGYLLHKHEECLRSGRVETAREEEAHQALTKISGC